MRAALSLHDLGLAFQIVDDLLDIEGDATELGRRLGKDEAAGKATFVSILGAERARRRRACWRDRRRRISDRSAQRRICYAKPQNSSWRVALEVGARFAVQGMIIQ